MKTKQELITTELAVYLKASKKQKGIILDSLERQTGMWRESIIRSLRREQLRSNMTPPKKRGRSVYYTHDVCLALEDVWKSANSCCGELLHPVLKEDLWWKFVDTERESYYREGRLYLENLGYQIISVTGDGLSLIRQAFLGISYQMCHVHMERIIVRGTTKDPVLEAGKMLLALVTYLKLSNRKL